MRSVSLAPCAVENEEEDSFMIVCRRASVLVVMECTGLSSDGGRTYQARRADRADR